MAIFGAGSKWNNEEVKERFFNEEKFILGWNDLNGKDLYEGISHLKVGDIIYIKSNRPGSRVINVKGIGFVRKSFVQCIIDNEYEEREISSWSSFFIRVKWVFKDEFTIEIPEKEGKLTNVRAATFYEENLPFVQNEIIEKITSNN